MDIREIGCDSVDWIEILRIGSNGGLLTIHISTAEDGPLP
jgi:hypothetical protein